MINDSMISRKSQAVIGCCFGDEGKGKVVSYLCSQTKRPLVIRYCGGHQAGHHVVIDDKLDHVFSNFGSGTLQGVDTYWSEYCTVDPVGIVNELSELKNKLISPSLYINENCPITTPYEKISNIKADKLSGHGSVGVGVGQTFQREEDHYSLIVSDLFHPKVLKIKLELLRKYYHIENVDYNNIYEESIYNFKRSCEKIIDSNNIIITNKINVKMYDNFIFEGGQGLLLDQNFGFFPHVTRSNTGTKNILKMGFSPGMLEIFLVTRAYLTRHGNGPLTNEKVPHSIRDNPYENNSDTSFQGKFRKSILDLNLIKYAISKDKFIKDLYEQNKINLVITCLDLIKDDYVLYSNDSVYSFNQEVDFLNKIKEELNLTKVYLSRTPYPKMIEG